MKTPAAIGIDIGSTTWKSVVTDIHGNVLAHHVESTRPRIEEQTKALIEVIFKETGASGDTPVGATGYGRKRIAAARSLTEITCHARGTFHLMKRAGLLIDMGGQDTKVIRIGPGGEVLDFSMNDKCAAGTGRFLEVILSRLHVPFEEIAAQAAKPSKPVDVSSTCTVFAESEVISLVAQGEPVEGIIKGLHLSLSTRVASLAGRIVDGTEIFMSGGVALNSVMIDALRNSLGRPITVVPQPQLVGALGAALSVL
jgi:(R)-2-hydroxyacyl-CoA dehydratese activating ATPase